MEPQQGSIRQDTQPIGWVKMTIDTASTEIFEHLGKQSALAGTSSLKRPGPAEKVGGEALTPAHDRRQGQHLTPTHSTTSETAPSDTSPRSLARSSTPAIGSTRVVGLSKWDGIVISIEDGLFTAELTPMDRLGPTVVSEFDVELLSADEITDLRVGSLFYLTVRTVSDRRLRSRTSSLRLRRLGVWSKQELDALSAEAKSLEEGLADLWE